MRNPILKTAATAFLLPAVAIFAQPAAAQSHHQQMMNAMKNMKMDQQSAAALGNVQYVRELRSYKIPSITVIDQNGQKVQLRKFLDEDRPTLVQFIFTSCTTICPIMGAVFGGAQDDLAKIAPNFRMVSISIDPEYDTPERLREFAAKQGAHGEWTLFTGEYNDIQKVIKAFNVLNQGDNKMYHQPYTFIRWRPTEKKWVRLRGLMSVADLVKEFKNAKSPNEALATN